MMWKPDEGKGRRSLTGKSMTTRIIGFGVLFGAIFLVLGSVALLGVSEGGPTYVGIPSDEDAQMPSDGRRFRLDMTVEEFRAEFRLTEEETDQLAVLVEDRDALQSQVDETLDGIRDLVGPGVHRLDAKRLSKQFDLDEQETIQLETLIGEWIQRSGALEDKTKEIMDFLAYIGVMRAR